MNNLIITTRQSPVRLHWLIMLPQSILWTLFALFIFFIRHGSADGLLLGKRGQKPTSFYFCWAAANAVVNCLGAVLISCVFKNSSIMQPTNIRRKNSAELSNT